MRYIYNLLFYLILPILPIRLLLRAKKSKAYKARVKERFAYFKNQPLTNSFWVHAVSVGEAQAAIPLIKALQKKFKNTKIVVTTMTPTGSEIVSKNLGNSVMQIYVPYDYPGAVKRFLKYINPKFLIIMETEIWPNILYFCNKKSIPIFLINARLSERSFKGYKKIKFFITKYLNYITLILTQSQKDGERFLALGLSKEKLITAGNIKYDIQIDEEVKIKGIKLREILGVSRPILVAASTHKNEEEKVLEAFKNIQKTIPNILLILVPRHPERFAEVFDLCLKSNQETVRFSNLINTNIVNSTNIILGDVMGQLLVFYAASDLAFVGGSLVPTGGHNLLEPSALGLPVITGPNLFNFQEIRDVMINGNALILVNNERELAEKAIMLLQNKDLLKQYGQAARLIIEKNQGVTEKILKAIDSVIQ